MRKAEQRADLVVDAGKIGAVRDVESFRRKDHGDPFAQLVPPAQAHVEVNKIRTETRCREELRSAARWWCGCHR